jgi:hypothetical protein
MCDYSLHAIASRPAKVGDTIVSTSFRGTSTRGFAAEGEPGVAVCLLPGTELAFDRDIKYDRNWISTRSAGTQVARFCAVELNRQHQHHDALMFPDGNTVLVTLLLEGQRARVLQLPVTVQERDANHKAEAVLSESPAEIAF